MIARPLASLAALIALGLPLGAADGYDDAMVAIDAGRFDEAARCLAAEPDACRRHEAWARVHIAAGDPTSGLRAAVAGLEEDPRHLGLLYQASRASLWLSAGEPATEYADRLLAALPSAPGLTRAARAEWKAQAESYRDQGLELVARGEVCQSAVRRARITSFGLLGACMAALVVLGLRR